MASPSSPTAGRATGARRECGPPGRRLVAVPCARPSGHGRPYLYRNTPSGNSAGPTDPLELTRIWKAGQARPETASATLDGGRVGPTDGHKPVSGPVVLTDGDLLLGSPGHALHRAARARPFRPLGCWSVADVGASGIDEYFPREPVGIDRAAWVRLRSPVDRGDESVPRPHFGRCLFGRCPVHG